MASNELETDERRDEEPEGKQQSFISHLIELRARILRALACLLLVMLCLTPFSNQLYTWLAEPLLVHLSGRASMIATEVASPFLAPFKLTMFVAVLISVPYIFYQAWAFVAPGLYLNERRLALPLLVSSVLLFYSGIAFSYFVVFPVIFGFFTSIAPQGVTVMTDISHYLDFVLKIFFAFGLAFEVPVATFLMVRTGIATVEDLSSKRPYVIIGAFVIGMLLTPDVLSQSMLALPLWLLYELGLLMCRLGIADADDLEERPAARSASEEPEQ